MSVTDLVWLLELLAAVALGVAVGVRMRPSVLGVVLGFALVVIAVILWGYSMEHYSNNACQTGEPCPTGDRVIRHINAVFLNGGATLLLVAWLRTVWTLLQPRHNRRRGPGRASDLTT
jgi:hypothetical protein